jgi:hypothetical protein
MRRPSGLNAALKTWPWCPWRTAITLPVAASQMRAVLSSDAVTMRRLSGLNAAPKALTGRDDSALGVLSAAFSPDGQRVVTASFDQTARIWRVFATTQELVDKTKDAVPRCLRGDERAATFLDVAPPAWCVEMAKWPYQSQDWKVWLRIQTRERGSADARYAGMENVDRGASSQMNRGRNAAYGTYLPFAAAPEYGGCRRHSGHRCDADIGHVSAASR